MSWIRTLLPIALVALAAAPALAEDPKPTESIRWAKDLPAAFASAKAEQKILMICVNAKSVDGTSKEEPAAKGLREVVYKDAQVVTKSRGFVCALLTKAGSSADYGELRALGIDGNIVSPQHIFVHPDGTRILLRKAYWSHGAGASGVKALLGMMAEAEGKLGQKDPAADPKPEEQPAAAAPAAEARAAWIRKQLKQVVEGAGTGRDTALKALVKHDKDGDCVQPLLDLLPEKKKDVPFLVAVIRALGRDGLGRAALPVAGHLKHKDPAVRGNAAVSLEYIGSPEKKVVAAIRKAADKEKDPALANHMYRALGRCGAKDAKVRAALLKKAASGKSEFASYGPCIALAYFEGDKKAMRGVEKLLKQLGVPGSRRGGGTNVVKRGVISWTLACIGDTKSGTFVREELLEKLENVKAFWVGGLRTFWTNVALACEGEKNRIPGIEEGVRGFVSFAKGADLGRYGAELRPLMDEYREGRDNEAFAPKGDHLLNDQRDM